MKFGKYLEDVQIPEWRHAYVRYGAHKKLIKQWVNHIGIDGLALPDRPTHSVGARGHQSVDESFKSILAQDLQTLETFFRNREDLIRTQFSNVSAESANCLNVSSFKEHCIILYNHCDFLVNFQIVNKVALGKLLKKFDKHLHRSLSQEYLPSLLENHVFQSEVPERLRNSTLDLLLSHVYNGDRRRAMRRLRPVSQTNLHAPAFRVGLMIGASIPLVAYSIVKIVLDKLTYTVWSQILYMYGSLFLIVLALFGYATNIYVCTKYRINYIFILELDRRSTITFMQIAEIASALLCLEAITLTITVSRWLDPWIDHVYLPLLLYALFLGMLICPFPILHRRSRWWFLKTFGRIALPLRTVRFADFFLADLMISLTFFWTSIYLSSCFYLLSPYNTDIPIVCNVKTSWISASLISWALIVRMIQCLRRFCDDNLNLLHLKNLFKYTLSVTTVYMSTFAAINGNMGPPFVSWLVLAFCSSLVSFLWDILVDWGVFRSERIFPRWTMVVISVLDVALRLAWVLTLSPTFIVSNNVLAFGLAVLEICRRYIWALFRLEHEHSNNVEHYRAVKEIPNGVFERHSI